MPGVVALHDRDELESFFRSRPHHLFELGDLESAYWPHTTWYGNRDDAGALCQVALLFGRFATPVLMLYGDPPVAEARSFAEGLLPLLPGRLYGHIGVELIDVMATAYEVTKSAQHNQMRLVRPTEVPQVAQGSVDTPAPDDADDLRRLYAEASPSTAFDSTSVTLAGGLWRCVRREGRIVSVAGLHVFSAEYRVAALGNVATHPSHRREGLSRLVCAALVGSLLERSIDTIGLDVTADNAAAIALYEGMGFELGPSYLGCNLTAR